MRKLKHVAQSGFTLLELLVVLGIIAMLAGIVGPQVMKHMGESKTKAAKVQIEDLSATIDMYKLDVGTYPTTN
jgi:general secretion pathway protein G